MATILVVDDHTDTNEVLCKLLRAHGHQTASAYTGEGALAMVGITNPDLIILDVMMPGMDGVEVLRMIRSHPHFSTLPVILFSAVSDPEFQRHAIQKGANAYWVKGGMDLAHLKDMITSYLCGSGATDAEGSSSQQPN